MSSENESVSPPLNIEKCSLVLVDVAGTTTSIGFVEETLFPYVTQKIETFLKEKWDEEPVKECIKLIKEDTDLDLKSATEKIKTLTTEKSSNQGLKTLQGLIYKEGYEKGDLKAHIFEDVPESFESWSKTRRVAIYSTGSTDSQKLLFSHTIHGDLSSHIHKYFDQAIGPKTEADSYKAIAKEAEVTSEEIVFLTDDLKEATAAKSGGVTAILVKRDGNAEFPEGVEKDFTVIVSFKDLGLDKSVKRKIEEVAPAEEAPPSKIPKTDATEAAEPQPAAKTEEKAESMEVDPPTEKTNEVKKTEETEKLGETKSTPEETEKPSEKAPEKTEKETKEDEDTEMKEEKVDAAKEENAQKEEAQVEEKKETKEVAEETPATTEEKTKEDEKIEESKVTETEKMQTEETKVVEKPEEATAEKTEEAKVTEETTKEETKPEEPKKADVVEETAKEETKVVEETAKATVEEPQTSQDKPEEPKEETKIEESAKTEESKAEDAKPAEEKPTENGDEKKETEEAETSSKVEEKENKSVLANGVENGKDESEVDTAGGETASAKIDDEKTDETDVKVKKLEESAESKTVSVEV